MFALVIFGAALLAVIFFIFGTFFKALASACNALLSFLRWILISFVAAVAAVVVLWIIVYMSDSMAGGNWGQLLWMIPLLGLMAGISGAIFYGLGTSILESVLSVVSFVVGGILSVSEKAADFCEKGYNKFLTIIIKQVEKC